MKTQNTIIDSNIFAKSTILMILLVIPFNVVHETGHAIVCSAEGKEFEMNILVDGSRLFCIGTMENQFLFYLFGGLFAGIIAFIPLLSKLRNYKWIVIPCMSFGVGHIINAVIESVFTKWYLEETTGPTVILGFIAFSSYMIFTIMFGRKK